MLNFRIFEYLLLKGLIINWGVDIKYLSDPVVSADWDN